MLQFTSYLCYKISFMSILKYFDVYGKYDKIYEEELIWLIFIWYLFAYIN